MQNQSRFRTIKQVSIVNATINTLLAIFKVIVGYIGHSHALIADGLHSFSDLITDALVFFAAKAAGRDPDQDHPYGHQRIETIAAIIIAIVLLIVAFSIIYDSATHMLSRQIAPIPDLAVLIVAIISILANEWLYRYTLQAGKKIQSALLINNAWHNRTDAFISTIVLIAVIGMIIGFQYLDAIGAILIGLFILKMGVKMIWDGVRELIDTAVGKEQLIMIKKTIKEVSGVVSIHELRTRMHSNNILVDVHILVDPFISVSEGHYISEKVRQYLIKTIPQINDVVVHIDPEDDQQAAPSIDLPNRKEIIAKLKSSWRELPGYSAIKKMTLHYLDGKLYIEIFIPQDAIDPTISLKQLNKLYSKSLNDKIVFANVIVHLAFPET